MKMGQNMANVRGQPQEKKEGWGSRHKKRKNRNDKQHKTPEGQEI